MTKKGFWKTLEVLIAVLLTFIFVIVIIPRFTPSTSQETNLGVLQDLQKNPGFQACAVVLDQDCVNQYIREALPSRYGFKVLLSRDFNAQAKDLPATRIFVDSIIITGNATYANQSVVRLFYWVGS